MKRAVTLRHKKGLRAIRQALPRGRLLPEQHWRQRHRTIVGLLWLHVFALTAYGLFEHFGVREVLLANGALVLLALVASLPPLSRTVRSTAASFGLVSASAILIYFSHGQIEAHFHFFFVVGILTLYQDWLPFLIALAYVVIHHGVLGTLEPSAVYNHPDAIAYPWKWAGIHAGFVFAASAANLVAWRVNERLLRDGLTLLPSRLVFMDRLAHALQRDGERRGTVAVLFIDMDRFKIFNDSLGHGAGDRLLEEVARRLEAPLDSSQMAARFGGDEFAILSPDTTEDEAQALARRVLATVSTPLEIGEAQMYPRISIGIAVSHGTSYLPEDLVRDADVAMYKAKSRGGNRIEVFEPSMRAQNLQQLDFENELRRAVEHREFKVFYQLERRLKDGRIIGVEALVRWQHPKRGLLNPLEFIDLAEDTGLIAEIDDFVLSAACAQLKSWEKELPRAQKLMMRVNASPRQLLQADYVQRIRQVVKKSGIQPEQLCVEITERVLVEDSESTVVVLRDLRALGVKLAIDDFGIEYSSLNYLKRFPVDVIKVDKAFVDDLLEDASDQAIIKAMIDMAHALGVTVTAEGVEEEKQLQLLQKLGCDTAQGELLGAAAPAAAISHILQQGVSRNRKTTRRARK